MASLMTLVRESDAPENRVVDLSGRPAPVARDPCGLRRVTSPFGNITMTTTERDAAIRCPISGVTIVSDGSGAVVRMDAERVSLARSRKVYTASETELLITHLRRAHDVGDNTNERMAPPPKGNKG